jgi:hypothetical protein
MYQYITYITLSQWDLPPQSHTGTLASSSSPDESVANSSVQATVLIAGQMRNGSETSRGRTEGIVGKGNDESGDPSAVGGESWSTKWEAAMAGLVRRDVRLSTKAWLYCSLVCTM